MIFKNDITPMLKENEYNNYKAFNKKSSVINNHDEKLTYSFDIEDIEMILVKDKGQISHINSCLKSSFGEVSQRKGIKPFIFTFDDINHNILGIEHHIVKI